MVINYVIYVIATFILTVLIDSLRVYIVYNMKRSKAARVCCKYKAHVTYDNLQITLTGYVQSVGLLNFKLKCDDGTILKIPLINGTEVEPDDGRVIIVHE